jgi:hypothetical protein
MYKALVATIIIGLLTLGMTGCQNGSGNSTATKAPTQTANTATGLTAVKAKSDSALPQESFRLLYFYEHKLMPRLWLTDSEGLSFELKEKSVAVLDDLLKSIQKDHKVTLEDSKQAAEPLKLSNGTEGWLITFPEPKMQPLSKFTAMVLDKGQARFITWEYDNFMGKATWFLCEWTADGMHLDYGSYEDGSKAAFLKCVESLTGNNVAKKAREPEACLIPAK